MDALAGCSLRLGGVCSGSSGWRVRDDCSTSLSLVSSRVLAVSHSFCRCPHSASTESNQVQCWLLACSHLNVNGGASTWNTAGCSCWTLQSHQRLNASGISIRIDAALKLPAAVLTTVTRNPHSLSVELISSATSLRLRHDRCIHA